jgi:5-methyltetrahydropteroyltriglutamate--homocysteine methyltransferase
VHLDVSADPEQLLQLAAQIPADKIISAGVISGRNIWKADLNKLNAVLHEAKKTLGARLWVATGSSLLHTPVDLDNETKLDAELKSWLAFATQKVHEVALLANILNKGQTSFSQELSANQQALQSRQHSTRIHNAAVQQRIASLTKQYAERKNAYAKRALAQHKVLKLPLLPTTTIGSFPQTKEIRVIRQDFKAGNIDAATYTQKIREQIADVIKRQERLDLDVLVHGEAERNDMVEYFGELLQGFAFTSNGWVQSYGSRCVKPPIIYGDVHRPKPMTVEWSQYAQSLTPRPVKGMLTGPVTILAWSFVRDDQPHAATALQIALALRDEVTDLEKAGINVIQIDEPAFREALPLRKNHWQEYLDWAVH